MSQLQNASGQNGMRPGHTPPVEGATSKISYAGYSHVGMKRLQNQDQFLCIPEFSAFVVADGMGGHKGGETASLLAITMICDTIRSIRTGQDPTMPAHTPAGQILLTALMAANEAVFQHAIANPALRGMGTTCTALMHEGDQIFIAQVGDSRCYLVHPGSIWQLTRDHSLVQEKLKAGLITRSEVKTDRMKNVITRSVGFENQLAVDLYTFSCHSGDVFMLCSDGLSGPCPDEEILDIVADQVFEKKDLLKATQNLCNAANSHGGDDNVTALIV